jgi:DNA-binding ferritin-like protein (Dps family)
VKLSKEAELFVENLHLYLLSTGKKEKERKEIVEELSDHLLEAEANGKNISDVTGESPKKYMESLASEMQTDLKEWGKLLPHVFISFIAYTLIGKIILGESQISLLVGIGSIIICFFMLGIYIVLFRFVASRNVSNKKTIGLVIPIQLLITGLFFVLMFYGNNYGPIYMIDTLSMQMLFFIIPFAYLCWFAWWSKTWVVFVPVLIYLPDVIAKPLSISEEMKSIISSIILMVIMLAYFIWIIWKGKKEQKTP